MEDPDLLEYQAGKEDSVEAAEVIVELFMLLIGAAAAYEATLLVIS